MSKNFSLGLIILLLTFECFGRDLHPLNTTDTSKDGLFHVGLLGQYSPGSKIGFGSYVSGTNPGPIITPGAAEFGTGSFTSLGLEFIFYTSVISGFSVGYVTDSDRNIEHKQLTYTNGSVTRTYLYPRDTMQNSAILFNYYLFHTPDRGYVILGLNYSNPKWVQNTVSNSRVNLSGDLGVQASAGFALIKGFILDITARTTSMKLRSDDPVANSFEDFGRGQMTDVLVGFKFIY